MRARAHRKWMFFLQCARTNANCVLFFFKLIYESETSTPFYNTFLFFQRRPRVLIIILIIIMCVISSAHIIIIFLMNFECSTLSHSTCNEIIYWIKKKRCLWWPLSFHDSGSPDGQHKSWTHTRTHIFIYIIYSFNVFVSLQSVYKTRTSGTKE